MGSTRSFELFEKAKGLIPGGVNSPVRAFNSVGLMPPFIKKAKGSRIFDEDGNTYIDYVGSWGPMILGHGNDQVISEIKQAVESGQALELLQKGRLSWQSLYVVLCRLLKWSGW